VKTLDKRAILAAALVAIAATAIFAMQASAGTPASKSAMAGRGTKIIKYSLEPAEESGSYTTPALLTAVIKTAEKKDLVISFTTECVLVTDTKIKGGGGVDQSMDHASIQVWVEVDGVEAFPGKVTFAERIQTLKGKLGWVYYDVDEAGNIVGVDGEEEEIELLLETTSANGFNFLMLDIESGVHEIAVYATIELEEEGQWTESEMERVAAGIGKRTLVIHEMRLVQDASP